MRASKPSPKYLNPRPRLRTRNILCLESLWDEDIVNKLSVHPILELTRRIARVDAVHLTCNTRAEFDFNMRFLSRRRRRFGILYLAFHGRPGILELSSTEKVSLSDLAEIIEGRMPGMVLHLGSCSTLKISDEAAQDFLKRSGITMISGYTRTVDWGESAALDQLLFSRLQDYVNLQSFVKAFQADYSSLIEKTGFRAFLRR